MDLVCFGVLVLALCGCQFLITYDLDFKQLYLFIVLFLCQMKRGMFYVALLSLSVPNQTEMNFCYDAINAFNTNVRSFFLGLYHLSNLKSVHAHGKKCTIKVLFWVWKNPCRCKIPT